MSAEINYYDQLAINKAVCPDNSALSASVCRTDARKDASNNHIARAYDSSANGLLQHGHSPSYPLTSAENASRLW
jgi:hypothetical protein